MNWMRMGSMANWFAFIANTLVTADRKGVPLSTSPTG